MSIFLEIQKKLDELYQKINPNNIEEWIDDVEKIINMLTFENKISRFKYALELVDKELSKQSNNKNTEIYRKLRKILGIIKQSEPDFLIEQLKRKSKKLPKELKNTIRDKALRIVEQSRLGKKDQVISILLRDFIIKEEKFPEELIEILKPKYDINQFRSFIYAFLSSLTESSKEDE